MLPGQAPIADPTIPHRISASASNVVLSSVLPAVCQDVPTQVRVVIDSGVIVDDAAKIGFAMLVTGLDLGCRLTLVNRGRISGYGGAGGDGGVNDSFVGDGIGGGGGGGAGALVGAGGTNTHPSSTPAQDGTAGTATLGGSGGVGKTVPGATDTDGKDGEDGGDALVYTSHALTIINANGQIWGGGGGGGGEGPNGGGNVEAGGDGGDIGEDGEPGGGGASDVAPGAGGAAGHYLNGGVAATFISGDVYPNVRGNVAP